MILYKGDNTHSLPGFWEGHILGYLTGYLTWLSITQWILLPGLFLLCIRVNSKLAAPKLFKQQNSFKIFDIQVIIFYYKFVLKTHFYQTTASFDFFFYFICILYYRKFQRYSKLEEKNVSPSHSFNNYQSLDNLAHLYLHLFYNFPNPKKQIMMKLVFNIIPFHL